MVDRASQDETGDLTRLLVDWSNGDERALDDLAPRVYDELRRLAQYFMSQERQDHTLQATALVHEAYLRLIDQRRVSWRGGSHFRALAARMMRRILVDHARRRGYAKRGGGAAPLSLDQVAAVAPERPAELVRLDEALRALSEFDEQLAKIVEMRFFGGLGSEEIGEVLGVSVPTVTRRWRLARAWMYRHMTGEASA